MASITPAHVAELISRGRAAEALSLTTRAIAQRPRDATWLHLHGYALHATGSSSEALASLETAISIAPGDAVIRNTFGAVALEAKRVDRAESELREALRLAPDYAEARFNLAQALLRKDDAPAALGEIERLLARHPAFLPARLERARLLVEAGRAAEALPLLEALLAEYPDDARIAANAAAACQRLGERERAAGYAGKALANANADAPELVAAAETFAALDDIGRRNEALRRAAATKTGSFARIGRASAGTLLSLASMLDKQGNARHARALLARAVDRGERAPHVLSTLAVYKARACDWDGLDDVLAELRRVALVPGSFPADPGHSIYFDGMDGMQQRRWAENWAAARWPHAASPRPPKRAARGTRLRVGFLSADFRDHPTSRLAVGFLEARDRNRFEYIAYSHRASDGSAMRDRIERAFDAFVSVEDEPTAKIAERIRADDLDILLDLGGHTQGSRLGVLAYRPAPLQGHFLGYPGTTGAPFVDFFISDAIATPPGAEAEFTERVVRMPITCQPNDPARGRPAPRSRREHGLPEGALVLGAFNQPIKITPRLFAQWCALLREVPRACLWILATDPECASNLRAAARAHDVDPARIVFAPRVPADEHVARLACADIALDTAPCTSHTTASDVLWAGVPMATTVGDTFSARMAASVLCAAGLADWCFTGADAEGSQLRDWMANGPLDGPRARALATRESALFDAAAFARSFEGLLDDLVSADEA